MRTASAGRAVLVAISVVLALSLSSASALAADSSQPEAGAAARAGAPLPPAAGLPGGAGRLSIVPDWLLGGALFPAAHAATVDTALLGVAAVPAAALPKCEYRDELTRFHKVKHWRKTLLDTNLRVKRSYEPWDLVSVRRANIKGSGKVRKILIEDLKAMARAARKAGKPLAVRSAYRSYATQVATFQSWVRRSGYQQALKFSARPGHSEHQLGTTVDFTAAPGAPLSSSFGASPSGKWIARNGWKYGFIMPYPKGKKRVSCYGYEPWHWRYVGRDLARRIHESGQVPRRYLWQNFESVP